MKNPRLPELRQKAAALPLCPGVYLMKDQKGTVIYVGKSLKLKNRVSSYFTGTPDRYKTEKMVEKVFDFDTVLCDTEIEALTLENLFIKKYTPKYNIRLKDAKSYPYIKWTEEAFPRLTVTRDRKPDGSRYYGPYSGLSVAYGVTDTLEKIFLLPTCRRVFPRDIGKERPCLYRDMGRCLAPCTGNLSAEEYRKKTAPVAAVLRGEIQEAVSILEKEMIAAAEAERFEDAAVLRDRITALTKLQEKQKVISREDNDADVFGFYTDDRMAAIAILSIRGGKLLNKNEFLFSGDEILDEDAIGSFLTDYYEAVSIPREIWLSVAISAEESNTISASLSRMAGHKVLLRNPKRGDADKLCALAQKNAKEKAEEAIRRQESTDKNLLLLTQMLGLAVVPDRIEAYDISNIGDESITASMIVYENGDLKKSDYRTFRVRVGEGRNDFASLAEALERRLSHIGKEEGSLGKRPDLILLDGGMGQVNAVLPVMDKYDLGIPIFGMVKDDFHKTRSFTDGVREISFGKERGVYLLIYRLQEEAHRVAYRSSQNDKRKRLRTSTLEKIPGIGPAKARLLFSAFGNMGRLKEAELCDIQAVRGIHKQEAMAVYRYFHPEYDPASMET